MDLHAVEQAVVAHWFYGVLYLVPPKYPFNVLWGLSFLLRGFLGLYRPHPGNYALNAALGLDQFCNSLAGGDPRETISSRADKARTEDQVWGCVLCAFLGWVATMLAGKPVDHCAESLEPNFGSEAVIPD